MKYGYVYALCFLLSCGVGMTSDKKSDPDHGPKPKNRNSKIIFDNGVLKHAAIDLFPVTNTGWSGAELSPEYAWAQKTKGGTFSGFGFFEARNRKPWFTNHGFNYVPPQIPFLALSAEVGGGPKGPFMQAGGKVHLHKLPFAGKVLAKTGSVTIGHFSKVAGVGTRNETLLAWGTREMTMGSIKIRSEGFYRIRGGGRPDYGQPQVWVRHPRFKRLQFGIELEAGAGKVNPLFGMRLVLVP